MRIKNETKPSKSFTSKNQNENPVTLCETQCECVCWQTKKIKQAFHTLLNVILNTKRQNEKNTKPTTVKRTFTSKKKEKNSKLTIIVNVSSWCMNMENQQTKKRIKMYYN
uniref:(northern house mosquito) hypothetical protein n=1 Tax=Culex pipiens TaxID=7175 RepID=A0A8D8MXS5_CULPI